MDTRPQLLPQECSEDRFGSLTATFWSMSAIATLIVALRMWSRFKSRSIWWDDWLMVLSLMFMYAIAGAVTRYAAVGGTRHLYCLDPSQTQEVLKWSYVFQCLGIFGFTPPKVSVALMINRVMRPLRGWRFWLIFVVVIILLVTNALDSIFTYIQCNPPSALWDTSIREHAKCWHPSIQANISIAQGAYNVFVDALLALIPATLFWKLKMSLRQRIVLSVLMGLGLIAAVAGSIKTSLLASLGARKDLTWSMYDLIVWSGVEEFVIVVCGSVPPLKPLFDQCISSKKLTSIMTVGKGSVGDQRTLIGSQSQLQASQYGKHSITMSSDFSVTESTSHLGIPTA